MPHCHLPAVALQCCPVLNADPMSCPHAAVTAELPGARVPSCAAWQLSELGRAG